MSEDLRDNARILLCHLADALIPSSSSMPAASSVLLDRGALARVRRVRPEMIERLQDALDMADRHGWVEPIQIRDADRPTFEAIAEVVCGAYLTEPDVARRLGYRGRIPLHGRPAEHEAEIAELTEPVRTRGNRWRLMGHLENPMFDTLGDDNGG